MADQLDREALGRAVKTARKGLDLTQEEFALQAGISTSSLRTVESGRFSGQPYSLRKIAKALGVSLDELVAGARPAGASPGDQLVEGSDGVPPVPVKTTRERRIPAQPAGAAARRGRHRAG